MAQTGGKPLRVETRQTGGPERHKGGLFGENSPMQGDGIAHQAQSRFGHAIDESRQIQAAHHASRQREHGRLIVHFLLGVTPIALLFRWNRQPGPGRNGGVHQRIALIGSRLQVQPRQLRVIGAHGSGTAILDHHIRMAAAQVIKPIQVGTAMREQTFTGRSGIDIGADPGNGVVIEFEEDRTEIVDQPIDGTRDMRTGLRRTEIKQIAPESHTRTP